MAETEKTEAPAAAKKKPPIKAIGVVAAIMVIEGLAVFFIVGATGHKPAVAEAHSIEGEHAADAESLVEVPLLDDKFQNMQSGKVWIWDTSIVLRVKQKNQDAVKQALEKRAAEIKEGVSIIFSKAQLSQLKEPGRETLNRQLSAFLNRVIGADPEGNPRIDRILFPRFRGFEAG